MSFNVMMRPATREEALTDAGFRPQILSSAEEAATR
jgi:hypothetical protein